MPRRETFETFDYLKVDINLWGLLAAPDQRRFPKRYRGDVYLDIGEAHRCVRNFYVKNIYVCTSGGFHTVVSGVTPTENYHLATKQYVDTNGGSGSFSGLVDVQSNGWSSGDWIYYNGTSFVPTAAPSGSGGGAGTNRYTEVFTATDTITITHSLSGYPQVTVLDSGNCVILTDICHDSINQTTLGFNGFISGATAIFDVGGSSTPTGTEVTKVSGVTYYPTSTQRTVLTSGNMTVFLPSGTLSQNRLLVIKKIDTGTTTTYISGSNTDKVDGNNSFQLVEQNHAVTVSCDGSDWYIESEYLPVLGLE